MKRPPYWMLKGILYLGPARHRRKLKEIAHEDNLHPSKWFKRNMSRAQKPIEVREEIPSKHWNLIDDQDWCLQKSLHEVLTGNQVFYLIIRKRMANPDTAPRVHRHPSDMRRRNPRRSRHCDRYRMLMAIGDKSVHKVRLSTPRRTRQEDILPHREDLKCLVLVHCRQCIRKGGYGKVITNQFFLSSQIKNSLQL